MIADFYTYPCGTTRHLSAGQKRAMHDRIDEIALAYLKQKAAAITDGSGGTPPAAVTLPPVYWMEAGQ